jgi:hypothetical protein
MVVCGDFGDHTTAAPIVASAARNSNKPLQRNIEDGGSQIGPNPIQG